MNDVMSDSDAKEYAADQPRREEPVGEASSQRHRRAHKTSVMPRLLPWASFMTRLWPGTKLIVWTALTTALLFWPSWISIGSVAALLLVCQIVAKAPRNAIPRLAVWIWSGLLGGAIGSSISGAFLLYLRAVSLTAVVLWGSLVLVWTTAPASFAPAIRSLLTPLRVLGLPVDEWVHVMVLALRGLPVLVEQTRAVINTAYLRQGINALFGSFRSFLSVSVDIVTASLSAASRAAAETGRAMTMRGGLPPFPDVRVQLTWRDGLALTVGAVAVAAIIVGNVVF